MDAPMVTSSRTVRAPMRSREPSRETRWPSSSMMPVNTSGPPGVEIYAEVVAQLGDGCEATARERGARRGSGPGDEPEGAVATAASRHEVPDVAVDGTPGVRPPRDAGPPLH